MMRVSTSYIHMQGVQNILEQQAKVLRSQDEVAQGKKLLKASDDPSATSRVLDINEALAQITQFGENGTYATQRLNHEESTIDSSVNLLQRVRELMIQVGNTGTYDLRSRQAIASEMRERLKEIFDYANTRDEHGDYLFAGFQSKIQPFTTDGVGNYFYNGDEGQLALQIGANRQVNANDPGSAIFQLIRTGNGVFNVDANITNSGTGRISTGSVVNPALYQAHDFSIEFSEVFPVTVDSVINPPSTLGVVSSTAINPQDPNFTHTIEIFFDPANTLNYFDVIDRTTGQTIQNNVPYTPGMTFDINGWEVQLSGAPQTGDSLTIRPGPPGYEYSVIDQTTGATVLSAQPYADGGAISFNGIEVNISGQPLDGDVFRVEASRYQDIFTSLDNIITSLTSPGATEVRGSFGGDYINNGFAAGDTITFDLNFDGQVINFSATPATPTNNEVATAFMTTISTQPNIIANPDGSYTLPGTTPGVSITFRRVGDNIEFITAGGAVDNTNRVVINNMADSGGGDAVLSVVSGGNTVATQTTLSAAVAGDSASYLAGAPHVSYVSQQIDNALNNIDRVMDRMIEVQTSIGGRINSIESQATDNESKRVYLNGVRSDIQDLDYAEAISNLTFQTTALQIAQQTFVRIQNLNLFNFL